LSGRRLGEGHCGILRGLMEALEGEVVLPHVDAGVLRKFDGEGVDELAVQELTASLAQTKSAAWAAPLPSPA
jgi:hypothetical protein